MTILMFLGVWLLASIPFGIMVGRFCAEGQAGELTRYLIVPSDRGEQ